VLDNYRSLIYAKIAAERLLPTTNGTGAIMNFNTYKNWLTKFIFVKNRIKNVAIWYLIFLMYATSKHSIEEASRFSGINKSQFSRYLQEYAGLAVYNLDNLSKEQAKQFAKGLKYLGNSKLFWKIAIIIDATIQNRTTRHTENSQRFNHGKGFVIGHQWTNIILIINDMVIPLPPIPFYNKKYCKQNKLEYKTEHELVIEYLKDFDLVDYIGIHKSEDIVVLADSGYDDRNIENIIAEKEWKFIIALKKTRSVKSEKQYLTTPKSRGWVKIDRFFKNQRRVKFRTIRINTNSTKKKRMEFRIRQIIGYLRYVGKCQLICSEYKKRLKGRRKYLACNDLRVTGRQILIGYRMRWAIEIFHKTVKMHLGFEDVATKYFESVKAHVHWVYCAYILLNLNPPKVFDYGKTPIEKKQKIREIVDSKEISRIRLKLTQSGGIEKYKNELRVALESIGHLVTPIVSGVRCI